MDNSSFEAVEPVYPSAQGGRRDPTKRRFRQRPTTLAAAALGSAVALVVAGVAAGVALSGHGRGARPVGVAAGPSTDSSLTTIPLATSTTPSTTLPPTTTTMTSTSLPPATSTTTAAVVAETTTTTLAPTTITGQVLDPSGQPVARAFIESAGVPYVITGDQGRYSIKCGGGPLLAGAWAVPLSSEDYDSTADVTTLGPGYIFSGGATDLSHATTPRCGSVVNFKLPPGAGVTIHFTNSMPSGDPGPADNLYLPGLDYGSYFIDPPLDSHNDQVVEQLGSGSLRIDGVGTGFDCSGPGVTGHGAIWYVSLTAGQSATVDCAFVQISG